MSDIQNQQTNPNVENNEEVTTSSEDLMEESTNNMAQILHLENLINGYMADVEKLGSEFKEQNQMLKDSLENDAEYSTVLEEARNVNKKKKEMKDKLMKDPSIALLDEKVNELRSELKEAKQALSDYLHEYFAQSGLRQITGTDGEVRDLVTTVRLVKTKG